MWLEEKPETSILKRKKKGKKSFSSAIENKGTRLTFAIKVDSKCLQNIFTPEYKINTRYSIKWKCCNGSIFFSAKEHIGLYTAADRAKEEIMIVGI